jgi:hypothetical protein
MRPATYGELAEQGQWEVLPYDSQIEAVHIALLRSGKVLYISGFRVAEDVRTETRLWHPRLGEIKAPPTPGDMFCAGHAFLPDGRLLCVGGTLEYRNVPPFPPWAVRLTRPLQPFLVRYFYGLYSKVQTDQIAPTGPTFLHLFDPDTEQWSFAGDMVLGRWYPTATALPDGRVLLLSGYDEGGGVGRKDEVKINRRVEIYDPDRGVYQVATIPQIADHPGGPHGPYPGGSGPYPGATGGETDPGHDHDHRQPGEIGPEHHDEEFPSDYPRMFVLPLLPDERDRFPKGKAFCAGMTPDTKMLDLDTWAWSDYGRVNFGTRHDGSCVLLPLRPPEYRPRVVVFGGRLHEEDVETGTATETAEIIDLRADPPTWEYLPPMSEPRVNACAVLLLDGKILLVGGNSTGRFDDPVHTVLLFDPDTLAWRAVAPISVPRGYHSTAILLPDGRVLSSGTTPYGNYELRMEVYSPYYFYRGARPGITDAPRRVGFGESFPVGHDLAAEVTSAAFVRPGAMTHALDMEQRYVELDCARLDDGRVTVTAPPDRHVAPPGYYLLTLLSDAGVPSEAVFVRLAP